MTDGAEVPLAVVVGVQLPGVSDDEFDSSLTEIERLGRTLGLFPGSRITQRRDALATAGVLGEGKLHDLAELTGGTGNTAFEVPRKKRRIDVPKEALAGETSGEPDSDAPPAPGKPTVVLVDHDLTPSQARNLERATGAEVLDRTSVILSIFQRHARSREAKLEVELARLAYLAPRLREQGAGQDRQRGGIGGKGAGESAIELDRRKIRDRMAELREEIAAIQAESGTRRARRESAPRVALVGYTNAGKSSLMRALTGSEVLVADKLFATLDTTVRALAPETRPRILVSDTVGFIKKLPHDLVASFRSTLDEAREASLLVHVVDAADPGFRRQKQVTEEVLAEIGAAGSETLLVLNKVDLVDDASCRALAVEYPQALLLSARRPADVAALHARIAAVFDSHMSDAELFVPFSAQRVVHEIHESCQVLSEQFDEHGTRLAVRAPAAVLGRLRAEIDAAGA